MTVQIAIVIEIVRNNSAGEIEIYFNLMLKACSSRIRLIDFRSTSVKNGRPSIYIFASEASMSALA